MSHNNKLKQQFLLKIHKEYLKQIRTLTSNIPLEQYIKQKK